MNNHVNQSIADTFFYIFLYFPAIVVLSSSSSSSSTMFYLKMWPCPPCAEGVVREGCAGLLGVVRGVVRRLCGDGC